MNLPNRLTKFISINYKIDTNNFTVGYIGHCEEQNCMTDTTFISKDFIISQRNKTKKVK